MKKIQKLCSVLLIVMLMLSLTTLNASAEAVEDTNTDEITDEIQSTSEDEETTVEDEEDIIDSVTFDDAKLQSDLANGVKQGHLLDLSKYYDGDIENLIVEVTNNNALCSNKGVLFTTAGDVTFTVDDGVNPKYTFTTVVTANLATALSLGETEVSIAVGETKDLYISLVPEDGWLEKDLQITAFYEGTGEIDIKGIPDPENANYIVGYTIKGVTAGTVTLTLSDKAGNLDPAVVKINIMNGTITGKPAGTVVGNTKSTVATGDVTSTFTYFSMLTASVVIGYIALTKKCSLFQNIEIIK